MENVIIILIIIAIFLLLMLVAMALFFCLNKLRTKKFLSVFDTIKEGMKKDELISLMGDNYSETFLNDNDSMLEWTLQKHTKDAESFAEAEKKKKILCIQVRLENDIVISKRRMNIFN